MSNPLQPLPGVQPGRHELATAAAAAAAKARIEATYTMATARPRDLMVTRRKLLDDSRRPGFAAAARYKIPRAGGSIEGPSIRFAEAAMRALCNVACETEITHDDPEKMIGRVIVIDLESNVPLSSAFTILKVMERRTLRNGDQPISSRTNSEGEIVHTLPIPETELLMKRESLAARLRRNLILQLLPGDIKDEALAACTQTLHDGGQDPQETARRVVDGFGVLGVTPEMLADHLGHSTATCSPREVEELRGLWTALNEGAVTWKDITDKEGPAVTEAPEAAEDNIDTVVHDLLEEVAAAETAMALKKLARKISKLPKDRQQAVRDLYETRRKELA